MRSGMEMTTTTGLEWNGTGPIKREDDTDDPLEDLDAIWNENDAGT